MTAPEDVPVGREAGTLPEDGSPGLFGSIEDIAREPSPVPYAVAAPSGASDRDGLSPETSEPADGASRTSREERGRD